jgi:hypothetical protein
VHPGAEITSADYEFSCTPETSSRAFVACLNLYASLRANELLDIL